MWLSSVMVSPGLLFAKLTFFLLYFQIFQPVRVMRVFIYAGAVITVLFYTATTIVQFVYFTPARGQTWVSKFAAEDSLKSIQVGVPIAAIGLVLDVYILVLPIFGVMQLQLSNKRRFGIIVVFLTGLMYLSQSLP